MRRGGRALLSDDEKSAGVKSAGVDRTSDTSSGRQSSVTVLDPPTAGLMSLDNAFRIKLGEGASLVRRSDASILRSFPGASPKPTDLTTAALFTEDSQTLLVGHASGAVQVVDLPSGKTLKTLTTCATGDGGRALALRSQQWFGLCGPGILG